MVNKLFVLIGFMLLCILFSCSDVKIVHRLEQEAIGDTSYATVLYTRSVNRFFVKILVEATITRYNKNWQVTNQISYYDNGKSYADFQYKYNRWGNLSEEKYYMPDNNGNKYLMSCSTFHYLTNKPQLLSDINVTNNRNELITKIEYEYPNDSLVIVRETTPRAGNDTNRAFEKYYYTKVNGNYYISIKQREFSEYHHQYNYTIDNGNLKRILEQENNQIRTTEISRDKLNRIDYISFRDEYGQKLTVFSYKDKEIFPYRERTVENKQEVGNITMSYVNGYLSEAFVKFSKELQIYNFKIFGKGFSQVSDSNSRVELVKLFAVSAIDDYMFLEDWQWRPASGTQFTSVPTSK